MTKSWAFRLIIANVAVYFIVGSLFPGESQMKITYYFGLIPVLVLQKGFIWQIFTYMFLHGSFLHLFVNMYALLIFGIPVEDFWGSRKFFGYFLFTGIGAGITIFLLNIIIGGEAAQIPTIGASGAIFGLLLAFGMLFPEAQILLFFVLPIRAKYLVLLYGGFELYSLMSSMGNSNISHIGHLGGLLFGIIYFLVTRRRGIKFKSKKFSAVISRNNEKKEIKSPSYKQDNRSFLLKTLNKVKGGGAEKLSDDEYQQLRYLTIMLQDTTDKCVEEDFNITDPYCEKCEHMEACLIREINKYI